MHYIYNSKEKPPHNTVSRDLKYQKLTYRLFTVLDGIASARISTLKFGSSDFVSGAC